jgi:hypothetical protein
MERSAGIGALLRRMEGLLAPLEAGGDPGSYFLREGREERDRELSGELAPDNAGQ